MRESRSRQHPNNYNIGFNSNEGDFVVEFNSEEEERRTRRSTQQQNRHHNQHHAFDRNNAASMHTSYSVRSRRRDSRRLLFIVSFFFGLASCFAAIGFFVLEKNSDERFGTTTTSSAVGLPSVENNHQAQSNTDGVPHLPLVPHSNDFADEEVKSEIEKEIETEVLQGDAFEDSEIETENEHSQSESESEILFEIPITVSVAEEEKEEGNEEIKLTEAETESESETSSTATSTQTEVELEVEAESPDIVKDVVVDFEEDLIEHDLSDNSHNHQDEDQTQVTQINDEQSSPLIVTAIDKRDDISTTTLNESSLEYKIKSRADLISSSSSFTEGTAQNKALAWLQGQAPTLEQLSTEFSDDINLDHLYVMAVFYYALGGEDWTLEADKVFMDVNRLVCDWDQITCNVKSNKINVIYFDNHNLTGEIPGVELGYLTDLSSLILKNDNISGPIPEQLGRLTKLKQLGLYSNNLTGRIPATLRSLSLLKYFNLGDNNLSGAIPSNLFDRMTSLESLQLHQNDLTGDIPAESLANCQNLEFLDLHSNSISGRMESVLGDLHSLKYMYLNQNNLEDDVPQEVMDLPLLKSLDISNNDMSGDLELPEDDSELVFFSCAGNDLEGDLSEFEFDKMPKLWYLYLSMNDFDGSLSSRLPRRMPLLRKFHAFSNDIDGDLPPEIVFQWPSLEELILSDNEMDEELEEVDVDTRDGETMQSQVTSLNLKKLYLSKNRFDGPIPKSIGYLQNLQDLRLDDNNFDEQVPAEIGRLQNLKIFLAFENNLVGEIPVELSTLTQLESLALDQNDLVGTVSPEICNLMGSGGSQVQGQGGMLMDFYADCGLETDSNGIVSRKMECSCCTVCCPGPDVCSS